MKHVFKTVLFTVLLSLCGTNVSAQKFMKKMFKKKANTEASQDQNQEVKDEAKDDTTKVMKPEDFLASSPSYSVKKVFELDENGEQLKNSDGTDVYKYLVIDKEGKVTDLKTAKKHLYAARKAGLLILAKVGGGAAAGGAIGKGLLGSKKGALIGAGIGAAVGLAASGKDIKKIKAEMKLYKDYKKLLEAYQKTFSEEGMPLQADVDLSDVDGINFNDCETISKPSSLVAQEIKESQQEGENMTLDEDTDFDIEIG